MYFAILYGMVGVLCLISRNGKRERSRFCACFLIFCGMQALIGLRHIQYGGPDTQVYARDFVRIVEQHYSLVDIFRNFFKDFGFYLFAWSFSLFSHNVNTFLFVCALPFTGGVTWLIYKYSRNIFLSFIMFLSFGFYLYNFQLVRHVFSLGIVILAYKYLEEGQDRKFFITVAVATFCHTLAILFFGAYLIKKGRITFKQVMWMFFGCVTVLILSQRTVLTLVFRVVPFLSSGRFAQFATRGGGMDSQAIIQLLFVLVSWVFLYGQGSRSLEYSSLQDEMLLSGCPESFSGKRLRNRLYIIAKQNVNLQFNMAVIATMFYLLTIAVGESYRMAQFFSLFTILLVPNALCRAPKVIRVMIELFIVLFGIKHFFGGLFVDGSVYNPYVFFWQQEQSLY